MARMGIFRIGIFVLAVVAISSLVSNGAAAAAAGIGLLFLLPLLAMKVVFVLMLMAFIGKRVSGGRSFTRGWEPRRREQGDGSSRPGESDRFEEWHRMAHAREEVDSWTPEVE